MTDADVLLIAGLGPGHLENYDLKGCFFDPSIDHQKYFNKIYSFGDYDYSPDKLYFKNSKGEKTFVLRPVEKTAPQLIVTTLCSILDAAKINYKFENISCIWNNTDCRYKVKVVCLSTTFMWSEYMIDVAFDWIKEHIDFEYFVIGGQYSVLKKDYIMSKYPYVDFLITGDAEISLTPLIKKLLCHNSKIDDVPNILYKVNNTVQATTESHGDINSYETPKYKGQHDNISYMSIKGCVHNCKFCALSFCTKKWQYRSAENIYEDWKHFKEFNNAKHIGVNDSTFFIPYKKVIDLLPLIKPLELTWEANARADTPFTEEDIIKLEESGCNALYFGFESMSDDVLGYINKKTTSVQNRRINDLFSKSSIYTMMSFIVGFPGETIFDFEKTKSYLINEHYGHFNIYIFEFEDKSMPIWEDAERFKIEVYEDTSKDWSHGGENWKHVGMTSRQADELRRNLLHDVRVSDNCQAIHKCWQYRFEPDFVEDADRHTLLKIERLLDKIVFAPVDFPQEDICRKEINLAVQELNRYGIQPHKNSI